MVFPHKHFNRTHTFHLKSLWRAQHMSHYQGIGYHTVSTFSLKSPAWLVGFMQSWIRVGSSLVSTLLSSHFCLAQILINAAIQLTPKRQQIPQGNSVVFVCSVIRGFRDELRLEHGLLQHLCDCCLIFHSHFIYIQAAFMVIACSRPGIEEGADYY